ncbi:hypothetical protein EQM13_12695 [Acidilutibacter cellobiosedens]|jgi:hypothetical protein|uniref:Uncharacterized protein n=1 Tax=Acidilutibacter cellobiosedens TaxID=2507161 RepID=A0A410QEF7_9FIRM|nr:hypothetical protein [Acidilutibacter cellobiosedens]QAT62356.1 hypothetical protein EQM13_12695 [Acidilutibacter cellobiosedens]
MEPIYNPNSKVIIANNDLTNNPTDVKNEEFGLSKSTTMGEMVEPDDTNISCCVSCCCCGGGGGGGTASLIEEDVIL